jgi:hypothetical protein
MEVVSDCQAVATGFSSVAMGFLNVHTCMHGWVWGQLKEGGFWGIRKVKAHRSMSDVNKDNPGDVYDFKCNDVADHLAKTLVGQYDEEKTECWLRLRQEGFDMLSDIVNQVKTNGPIAFFPKKTEEGSGKETA